MRHHSGAGQKMVTCPLCGGEGFIYTGPQASPCPECWGSGKVPAKDG
jgi:DnaJ-class molecular chaperone